MLIEISVGELADKISILAIKLEKFRDAEKRKNVENEYAILLPKMLATGINTVSEEYLALKEVNLKLWDIEDNLRIKESKKEFDTQFIKLARSVYYQNDERARIKKDINLACGSALVEEKEYVEYK
ncbi:MAG: DUF6165 family protein [Candidatus Cloacimonetes bacterium]|nr:DUF6165 family protein [Candidatus Cloacimonadota bacterium]